MSEIKIVVIDCPIKHWNHPLVREMYHKIINLKLAGFHSKKPDNYLPVDTTDFIGTHIVACNENDDGSLHPIMGFKGVTLERCLHYGQNFSGRNALASVHSDIHKLALDQYITQSLNDGHTLSHNSSLAVDPSLKGRKKLEAMKLIFPLALFHYREFSLTRLISFGSITSKTHITFRKLGFHPILHAGKPLPPVCIPAIQNEEAEIMTLENFSAECEALAVANQALWDERIEISDKTA